jgi:hypothetical protein
MRVATGARASLGEEQTMKRTIFAFATAAVLAACADAPTAPLTSSPEASADVQAATSYTYFGQATVLRAKTLVLDLTLVQAHVGPPGPGLDSETLLNINVPGIITGQIADASVDARNGRTVSRAEVADVTILAGLNTIRVRLLRSTAESTCQGSGGFSDILGLTVNGKTITISGKPNQKVPLILGSLVINEQFLQPSIGKVTALHLKVGVLDLRVSEAIASVKCKGH